VLNFRYMSRFLVRVGADDEGMILHNALVSAGKGSPLHRDQLTGFGARHGAGMTGADVVALARTALKQHTGPPLRNSPDLGIS